MKIPQSLPQFEDASTLFIVSGKQHAHLYFAHNGQMRHIAEIRVADPTYQDREGLFVSGGNGQNFRSGSVYERKEEGTLYAFSSELVKRVETALKHLRAEEIVFFAPRHISGFLQARFPVHIRERIRAFIPGNYTFEHPVVVLARLEKEKQLV